MPMKPHKDESQSDFMARCVPEMIGTGDDKRPQDQAVAACMQIWRDKDKALRAKQDDDGCDCEPEPDESYDDFMDRCTGDEGYGEDECQMAWDDSDNADSAGERGLNGIPHKTHSGKVSGLEF